MPSDFVIVGARIVVGNSIESTTVEIKDGRIERIGAPVPAGARVVDAGRRLVAPGLIDLHGDAFERQWMPRPQVRFPIAVALADSDRQLATHGITTAYHGVTWSWEGGLRGRDSARTLIEAVRARRHAPGIDHRVHLRFETHNVSEADEVAATLAAGDVHFLAFNDHLADIAHKSAAHPAKLASYAERAETNVDEFRARIARAQASASQVADVIARLAAHARQRGIAMASHDDDTADDRTRYHALGVQVAEFPRTPEALNAALALRSHVVLGSPNVVRGGSHCGAIDATTAILDGRCHVLTSDYYYPALLHAPYVLAHRHGVPLAAAWDLVSAGPARAAGLGDRGHLQPGMRADIVVVDDEDPAMPRVLATLSGGHTTYLAQHDISAAFHPAATHASTTTSPFATPIVSAGDYALAQ